MRGTEVPCEELQPQAAIRGHETGQPLAPKPQETRGQQAAIESPPLLPRLCAGGTSHLNALPRGSDGRGDPTPQTLHIPGSRPSSRVSSWTTCTSMARSRKRKAKVRQTERSPPSSALKYNRVTTRNILLGAGLRKP